VSSVRDRLAREEGGFTLVELLTATVIGTVILLVSFSMLDTTIRSFGSSEARTDVAQRGRLALDNVTQRLRSPVCIEPSTSAVLSATPTSISFWSDLTGSDFDPDDPADPNDRVSPQPVVRELAVTNGVLTETIRAAPSGAVVQAPRELLSGVTGTPTFTYFALSPQVPLPRTATVALGSTVASADLARIARIRVAFTVNPRNPQHQRVATDFTNDVYIRSIDVGSAGGVIRCIAA
jgi:type II secretory pathway pseudopilin PulG